MGIRREGWGVEGRGRANVSVWIRARVRVFRLSAFPNMGPIWSSKAVTSPSTLSAALSPWPPTSWRRRR